MNVKYLYFLLIIANLFCFLGCENKQDDESFSLTEKYYSNNQNIASINEFDSLQIYSPYLVDILPQFIGGNDSLKKVLNNDLKKQIFDRFKETNFIHLFLRISREGYSHLLNRYRESYYRNVSFIKILDTNLKKIDRWFPAKINNISVNTFICYPLIKNDDKNGIKLFNNVDTARIYSTYEVDILPQFIGKKDSLIKILEDEILKPILNFKEINDYIHLCIIIDRQGNSKIFNILCSSWYNDNYVLSIFENGIRKMNRWIPGKINNVPVKTIICFPLSILLF